MSLFDRKPKTHIELPPILVEQEEPVNYNSVLDYLVGLSTEDHKKLFTVSQIYRDANKRAAVILGVPDKPTTAIKSDPLPTEALDTALDQAIQAEALSFDSLPSEPLDDLPTRNNKIKQVDTKDAH